MKFKRIPIYKLMPNLLTITGLCLGISALRYALDEKFMIACGLILTATVMDCLDGRLARILKCESDFGAQLDSLADIVSFGVAPSMVCYLWSLHKIPYIGIGWSIVLFYITCNALRLARFNSEINCNEMSQKSKTYFKGMPVPSAAALCLLPLITTFEIYPYQYSTLFIACYMIVLGILMISRMPTFSGKNIVIPEKYIICVNTFFCLIVIALALEPWITLPIIGLAYMISLPLSVMSHYKKYGSILINKPVIKQ